MVSKLEILKAILSEHQYRKVKSCGRWMILDAITANAILGVYNSLSDSSKEKFLKLDWSKMAALAYRKIT